MESFCDMGDFRLVLCERQAHGAEESSKFLFHSEGCRLCSITEHNEVIGVSQVEVVAESLLPAAMSLTRRQVEVIGFHIRIQCMEVYVGEQGARYTSYKVANLLVEFSTS